jgi:tRNA 2-thiouridine synthesizing protein A
VETIGLPQAALRSGKRVGGKFKKSRGLQEMGNSVRPVQTLDMKGMNCPMPLIWARNMIDMLAPGETLEVLATDPGTIRDFKAYASSTGHELVEWSEARGQIRILMRKSLAPVTPAA